MTPRRFDRPGPGAPTPVRFPAIARETLDSGLGIWVVQHAPVPVATITLIVARGTGDDPVDRHGLASLTGDLLDEGAGDRDAIQLADAFAGLGTQLEVDVGPDATALSVTTLSRVLGPVLALMADVVARPRLAAADFNRVRELRLNRLRQLSRSAATVADRMYVSAVFGTHAYGHGALGTTASLDAITLEDTREFWTRMYASSTATLIVVGDVQADEVVREARRAFGRWVGSIESGPRLTAPDAPPDPRVFLVDRPGAPQAELRLGHLGPPRQTPVYHALVGVNAVLGGQFTSRINRRLREEMGVTYGARTTFDFRRVGGAFSCDSSVDATAAADAVRDVLTEFDLIREGPVPDDELASAKASLTRGYVRNFETGGQIARAVAQIATHGLPDDTFDRFVPAIEAITAEQVQAAAEVFIRPADATIVVVGDAERSREALAAIGRPVVVSAPEF
jgi:predicted Zn-dependent peptidase